MTYTVKFSRPRREITEIIPTTRVDIRVTNDAGLDMFAGKIYGSLNTYDARLEDWFRAKFDFGTGSVGAITLKEIKNYIRCKVEGRYDA